MSIPEITVDELARRLASGSAVLFDVRNPDEYVAGHVPSATLIPLHEVPERSAEFPRTGEVLVICKSGGRSAQATEFLRDLGVDAVNLHHGEWSAGLVALFHRFGRRCLGWDAQHIRIVTALLRAGIDGIFSDHVDRLVDGAEALR